MTAVNRQPAAGTPGKRSRVEEGSGELELLPRVLRAEFPRLEPPSPADLQVIQRQLGRPPRGDILVALRCWHRKPAVILTVPFRQPGGTLPPLLWLSCLHAAREMGRLESEGGAREFDRRLELDREAAKRQAEDDKRFAALQDALARQGLGDEFAEKLGPRGVAGGRAGGVKCLHAHLAYRLAGGGGQVGRWCLDWLEETAGKWCENIPQACLY